ncbi:hypothetical protein FHR99_003144 [Litorivivens lipolytica]|uniref:Uncharacterized protein n=1 Tax=Litorivivens lipolytica TaxID=1524264 RepID=A0A7W4W7T8_9GAMM|nr:hypothetical protein [Litorivivens lipolytica]
MQLAITYIPAALDASHRKISNIEGNFIHFIDLEVWRVKP